LYNVHILSLTVLFNSLLDILLLNLTFVTFDETTWDNMKHFFLKGDNSQIISACVSLKLINDSLVVEKSWYDSWIYDYLCNQCSSSVTFRVIILLRRGVLDTTLCDKVCQSLETGRSFSPEGLQIGDFNGHVRPKICDTCAE
jgi:hypothetical protein